jgi:hypothetical protein
MAILLFMVNYEIAESEPDEREKKKPIPNNQHGLMNKKIRAGRKPSSVLPVAREWWSFIWALDCSKARATYPEVSNGPSLLPIAREMLPYVVLLQAGFSKHSRSPGNLVGSYPTVSPLPLYGAVFFSVALSMGSPPVPFRDRLALRSSDFPPPIAGERSPHPL